MAEKLPDRFTFAIPDDLKTKLYEIKRDWFWSATYSEMIRVLLVQGIDSYERKKKRMGVKK